MPTFAERLRDAGYETAYIGERPGHVHPTPLRLYRPDILVGSDIYGQSRILEMLAKVEPDVVVTVLDATVVLRLLFDNQYDPERILLRYRPLIAYLPYDGINLPPAGRRSCPRSRTRSR